MTFADFAATEIRFRKHFRVAPPETWNDNMLPLAEFLELAEDEREDKFPYVWSVDREQQLMRLLVAEPIVRSCEDRRDFWTMLRSIARVGEKPIDRGQIEADVRRELTGKLASGLMQLMAGESETAADAVQPAVVVPTSEATGNGAAPANGQYMAPWIDTAEVHVLRRVHQLESQHLCLQRAEEGHDQESAGRSLQRSSQSRRTLHRWRHSPGAAKGSQRKRNRETDRPR